MSNTQNDLRRKYVKELKELNLDDPEFDLKFGKINESFNSSQTRSNNGIRKAKSISRTEKYDGKQKSVKQVSKFQDGDKYVEEYLNPDGTTHRIEKKIEKDAKLIQK